MLVALVVFMLVCGGILYGMYLCEGVAKSSSELIKCLDEMIDLKNEIIAKMYEQIDLYKERLALKDKEIEQLKLNRKEKNESKNTRSN
jgi:predicted PurR-regulated permease PerM